MKTWLKIDKSGKLKKSWSILFIEDRIDHYSLRCMSDPNFMALALAVPNKTWLNTLNTKKQQKVAGSFNCKK